MSWEAYTKRIEDELDLMEDGCYSQEESLLESGEYLERETFYTTDTSGKVYVSSSLDRPKGPLYVDAAELGSSALKIYLFLWNAAGMDYCRKIYNTNNWTIKGIAGELGMQRKTVGNAIDKLLDDGLIQIIGEQDSNNGSRSTIWGVTHSDWIENVRYAISMMGDLPSTRLKKMRLKGKKVDTSGISEEYKDLSWLEYESTAPPVQGPKVPITPLQPWLKQHIKNLQDKGLL